jgi:hypothetical protein
MGKQKKKSIPIIRRNHTKTKCVCMHVGGGDGADNILNFCTMIVWCVQTELCIYIFKAHKFLPKIHRIMTVAWHTGTPIENWQWIGDHCKLQVYVVHPKNYLESVIKYYNLKSSNITYTYIGIVLLHITMLYINQVTERIFSVEGHM